MHGAPARSGCFRHDAKGVFILLLGVWRGFAWFEAQLWLRNAASTARGCFSGRSSSAKGHHELELLGFLLGRTCRAWGGGGRGFTWLCAPKMALHGLTGSFPSASDEQGGRRKHRGTTRGSCSTFKPGSSSSSARRKVLARESLGFRCQLDASCLPEGFQPLAGAFLLCQLLKPSWGVSGQGQDRFRSTNPGRSQAAATLGGLERGWRVEGASSCLLWEPATRWPKDLLVQGSVPAQRAATALSRARGQGASPQNAPPELSPALQNTGCF